MSRTRNNSIFTKYFDAWLSVEDSTYFDFPCARVELKRSCKRIKDQQAIVNFCDQFTFVTIVNHCNDSYNNVWLGEKTSVFLADINIRLSKIPARTGSFVKSASMVLGDQVRPDAQILRLASKAFKYSRFYNDPYMPSAPAKAVYADIVRNAFKVKGQYFILIGAMRKREAFLLFTIDQSSSVAIIRLLASDLAFRGKGVGKRLIAIFEDYVSKRGIRLVKVGTQVENVAALSFYQSCGFEFESTNSVYHYWPKGSISPLRK